MEPNRRRGQSFIDDDDARDMSVTSCSGDGGPELPSFDPNMTFDDETNKDSDDFDESNEEEYFSRGRSRSRSVHENDDKVKTLTDQELKAQVAKAKDHPTERPKVEKTGPLQGREVAILQQVHSPYGVPRSDVALGITRGNKPETGGRKTRRASRVRSCDARERAEVDELQSWTRITSCSNWDRSPHEKSEDLAVRR
jgi:hypothetical protein